MREVRSELRGLRDELREELQQTRTELRGETKDLREEVDSRAARAEGALNRPVEILFGALATGFVGLVLTYFLR